MTSSETLNAFDTSGRVFLRTLLREGPSAESVAALRFVMRTEGAKYSLEEIAAEVGVSLPRLPVPPAVVRPRYHPPAKSRRR